MVRHDEHAVGLKKNLLKAMLETSEGADASEAALLLAPLGRVAHVVDTILDRLEWCDRALLELLFGLGDGHPYSYAEAAHVFDMLPEHVSFEERRILCRCRQILEHIGI